MAGCHLERGGGGELWAGALWVGGGQGGYVGAAAGSCVGGMCCCRLPRRVGISRWEEARGKEGCMVEGGEAAVWVPIWKRWGLRPLDGKGRRDEYLWLPALCLFV